MNNPQEMNVPAKIKIGFTHNGKPACIAAASTVSDFLTQEKSRPELVTVEINGSILQKLDYETTVLRQGDLVECVFYIGGGAVAE